MDVAYFLDEWAEKKAAGQPTPTKRMLLLGAGGSGKTHVTTKFIVPLCEKVFSEAGVVTIAPSNAQAKTIGGITAHSAGGLKAAGTFPQAKLGLNGDLKKRLQKTWDPARVLICEESSMVSCELYQAVAYRATLAREKEHNLNKKHWDEPGQEFGAMPLIIHLGDFLQLRPREMGLSDSDERVEKIWQTRKYPPSRAAQRGRHMFQRIKNVHILQGGKRFVDDDLPMLLNCMRAGRPIPEELWKKVLEQRIRVDGPDDRLNKPEVLNGDECGIAWQTVSRWMMARAKRDAKRAKQVLYVVPAIDVHSGTASRALNNAVREALLRHPNAMETGKMMGMCPLHIGMRIRLSTNLYPNLGLVPETECTIVRIDLDEEIPPDQDVVILKRHPLAVYVQLDMKNDDGVPLETLAEKLAKHQNIAPEVRKAFPDELAKRNIVALQAMPSFPFHFRHNMYSLGRNGKTVKKEYDYYVKRYQLPFFAARVRTAHSAQGQTFQGMAVLDLGKAGNMDPDTWWLNVYMMLSRPKALNRALLLNLPTRDEIFNKGPPPDLRRLLQQQEQHVEDTRARVERAMAANRHGTGSR